MGLYQMNKKQITFLGVLVGLLLWASTVMANQHQQNFVIAKAMQVKKDLYYRGVLQPIKEVKVTSPVDGVVTKKYFKYGSTVTRDELLLKINSSKLETDYRTALSEFLKAKQQFQENKRRFKGDSELHQLGIISDEDYRSSQNQLNSSHISYQQALYNLNQIIPRDKRRSLDLDELDLSNYEKIKDALNMNYDDLDIRAPDGGVVLFPLEKTSEDYKQIIVGSRTKLGDTLLTVGDLSGFAIDIQVNEKDIAQFQPGQAVVVTGLAFPNLQINGQVANVTTQARGDGGQSTGMQIFDVRIEIPNLKSIEKQQLHVGMSAKVDVTVVNKSRVVLPLSAVGKDSNGAYVEVLMPDGTRKKKNVSVAWTRQKDVVVKSGVNVGDKVFINDVTVN